MTCFYLALIGLSLVALGDLRRMVRGGRRTPPSIPPSGEHANGPAGGAVHG